MSNKNITVTKLISQAQICESEKDWHRDVFRDIETRLAGGNDFPCVFSRNAFRKQLLKFIFVETIDARGIQHLADGLKDYVEMSRVWDNSLDTAYPLVVAFSLNATDAQSVEEHHVFGWNVLQKLHEVDPAPWPEEVGKDPNSNTWSMCFNGMPFSAI